MLDRSGIFVFTPPMKKLERAIARFLQAMCLFSWYETTLATEGNNIRYFLNGEYNVTYVSGHNV